MCRVGIIDISRFDVLAVRGFGLVYFVISSLGWELVGWVVLVVFLVGFDLVLGF